MNTLLLVAVLLALSAAGYHLGRRRALSLVGHPRELNSLPGYYGSWILLWCLLPSILALAAWISLEGTIVDGLVINRLPAEVQQMPDDRLGLFLNDAKNLATGNIVSREVDATLQAAADRYAALRQTGKSARTGLVILLAGAGILVGYRLVSQRLRAMQRVEAAFKALLMVGSTIAIFTTIGIVLSLLFESIRFFQAVSVTEFLFGLEWSPQTALRADQVGSSGSFGLTKRVRAYPASSLKR